MTKIWAIFFWLFFSSFLFLVQEKMLKVQLHSSHGEIHEKNGLILSIGKNCKAHIGIGKSQSLTVCGGARME
jgi:hypothetical protein